MTLYPYGYGTATRTLDWLEEWLLVHHHPEYVRRLVAWLESKDGVIGVGGGWRPGGGQPDKPGFAPEGKSFHQNQRYADGFIGACAVDVVKANPGGVHRTVAWSDVPAQGSTAARIWGVHANVATEAWHIQPVEIDGWQSWVNAGSPAPVPGYPLPTDPPPASSTKVAGGLDVVLVMKYGTNPDSGWSGYFSPNGGVTRHGVRGMDHAAMLVKLGALDAVTGARVTAENWLGVSITSDVAVLNDKLGV